MTKPRLALLLSAVILATFVAFGVLYLSPITPAAVSESAGGPTTAFFVLPFATYAVVGALIAARRPENPIGWLLIGAAALLMIGAFCSLVGSLLHYAHNPAGQWVALGGITWAGGASPLTFLFFLAVMLFPDGHLPSPRWRWLVAVEAVFTALTVAVVLLAPLPLGIGFSTDTAVNPPNPLAVPALAGVANAFSSGPVQILQYLLSFIAVVSVFLRLRGADSERRHQIRWFAAGAAAEVVFIALTTILPNPGYQDALFIAGFSALALLSTLAIPVAVTVAILKYRLYDIDIIISRALVYGVLGAFITAVYVGIAVGIGSLVGSGGQPNLGLSILATVVVAVGFQPVRERLQKLANRVVYGKRATPYEVLSEFSGRVAESYASEEVLPRMARLLQEGTGAERATVWLRSGEELRVAAIHPAAVDGEMSRVLPVDALSEAGDTHAAPVEHQGEMLGALSVSKRRGESLTPIETKLMDDLAHQAGLVLKNVRLTTELMERLEELRASRQRLVSAQDEERRRLERNLHDGAQQHLVALKVKLGLAEMLLTRDVEKARTTLAQLKTDADEALETLRDLARGIYPPLLADRGLGAALESQARKVTLPVTVEADGVGRHPQEVEAAVYFCVLEALQNVQKYAQASHATIRLRDADGELRFEVEDDGTGFDTTATPRGSGLTNMVDRLDALGGSVTLESSPGKGTRLTASLPVRAPVAPATDLEVATATVE